MKLISLIKLDIKQNWGVFTILLGVLILYLTIMINMFDPNGLEKLQAIADLKMPPELLKAFGFEINTNDSLLKMISSFYYGMLIYMILIIYVIIVGNRLIAEHVTKGSMGYLLATPHTRKQIVFTQALFFITTIALQIMVLTITGITFAESKFPGYLDINAFIILNIGIFLIFGIFSGISFLSSCIFNESKLSTAFGAGIPIAFILIDILSNTDKSLDFLHNFTIITLIDKNAIINHSNILLNFGIMTVIALALYYIGIVIFSKKDLSI